MDDYGCEFCRSDDNLLYGHVRQLATSPDETRGVLLKCPKCMALYEDPANGLRPVPISAEEASRVFPDSANNRDGRP